LAQYPDDEINDTFSYIFTELSRLLYVYNFWRVSLTNTNSSTKSVSTSERCRIGNMALSSSSSMLPSIAPPTRRRSSAPEYCPPCYPCSKWTCGILLNQAKQFSNSASSRNQIPQWTLLSRPGSQIRYGCMAWCHF
jgi:hypothetical protein